MSMNELGLRNHLKEDIERHQRFQAMLGIERQEFQLQDFDIKNGNVLVSVLKKPMVSRLSLFVLLDKVERY